MTGGNAQCLAARAAGTGDNVISNTCAQVQVSGVNHGVCQCNGNKDCSTTLASPVCLAVTGAAAVAGGNDESCQVKSSNRSNVKAYD